MAFQSFCLSSCYESFITSLCNGNHTRYLRKKINNNLQGTLWEGDGGGLDQSNCKVISLTTGVTKCENKRHTRLLIARYLRQIDNGFSALNHPFQTYVAEKKRERASSIRLKSESMLPQNRPMHSCVFLGCESLDNLKKINKLQTMDFCLPKQLPSSNPLADEMRSFLRRNIPCFIVAICLFFW